MQIPQILDPYCQNWNLKDPQQIFASQWVAAYRVEHLGQSAVLKIFLTPRSDEVLLSSAALKYFAGWGAAELLASDSRAQLLEFLSGESLQDCVSLGKDEQATEILAQVVRQLHSRPMESLPNLPLLSGHLKELLEFARTKYTDRIYAEAIPLVEYLLGTEKDVRVPHGDIHHGNVLGCLQYGWRSIDPKGMIGERTFDVANILFNPEDLSPGTLTSLVDVRCRILCQQLQLNPQRVLQYAFVFGCLKIMWQIEDGQPNQNTRAVVEHLKDLIK